MFKHARVEGESLPCVIFPDPDTIYDWLERAKVLQTEDEFEKQESLYSRDSDDLIKMEQENENLS